MQPQGDALESKVNALVAEKRYGDAQELLGNIPRDSVDYRRFAEKRKQVDTLAAQYERKTIEDARQLVMQDRWSQALDLYDEALSRMPRSSRLRDGLTDLKRIQQMRVAGQDNELLITKGEWLASVLPTSRRLVQIDPRNTQQAKQLQQHQEEGHKTAAELLKVGSAALESGDYELAERTIPLAGKISDKPEIRQTVARFEQGRDKRARELRNRQEQRQHQATLREGDRFDTIGQLQYDYDRALEQHDYLAARSLLAKLRTYTPEVVAERGYERDLKGRIEDEADRLYKEGVTHYGHSEFEKARDSWQKVLELVPNHAKAKESMARVNKVLGKIDNLRKKQKGE